ncbi:DeoR/GlpR transcriptional regulator [Clostridium sp. YIM B02505]|uniref:DeoR/GlpR transcriptional regulator n=1 Tax=Clostridium yunnanense TaxID=2800325 RepID=A0ABS1EIA7_9CLOT|nr:DeoR/GlpR family DNA-binding transcription regulator [Clostridium yunnanense]MBK1809099.1 DeoR/GlpR transcriptional regulator [Clostridium yunnanense]
MFAEERLNEIIELLSKDGKVLVKDLSIRFNVTEGMIRKDLQKLEKDGAIKRTYGGAILKRNIAESTSISNRLIKNLESKRIIAEKAFDLIEENDTIFLDVSSINFVLAELIASSTKKFTVITNMVEITSVFNDSSNVNIICIGGTYNKSLGGIIGSEAIESIKRYRVNKAFMGSCGINLSDRTISNFDLEEGNTKKAIMSSARTVYTLIENEKFNMDGTYKFADLDDIDCIITEEKPVSKIYEEIKKLNIKLI